MNGPRALLLLAAWLLARPLTADEGMWLLDQPPRDLLKARYRFDLTADWLATAQRAAVRFNNGGSGGFVSPRGLVVTNHHIGADSLLKLSGPGKDLHRDGYLARTPADELKCPDLELNVLQEIVDVTEPVQAAVLPGMSPAAALAARKAVQAKLTNESEAATGLRSDLVTLYHGGLYHLYRYKKYTDVRLVFAPDHGIAAFGGDVDNFEYPRYNLDVCFFRVYEGGRPARTDHFFRWSPAGPADGDLVFVVGHPGTTNRQETLAHLEHRRDVTFPYTLSLLRHREALLSQYAATGPAARLHAQKDLYPVANARKALTGQYHGLLDPRLLAAKEKQEAALRDSYPPQTVGTAVPWQRLADVHRQLAGFERLHALLEKGHAFDSRLFAVARHLVRLADELPKPDAERLSEYRTAALKSLTFQLLSPAPIAPELERVKLAGSLAFLAEHLGGEHPLVAKVLAGHSPAARAAALVGGTRLADPKERQRLLDAGRAGVDAADDAMLALARLVDAEARALRQKYDEVEEVRQQEYGRLAAGLFRKHGTAVPPDATFTLRLAFGVVKGYEEDGKAVPFATTVGQMFARAEEQGHREPYDLPPRWRDARGQVDPATPFNFVSTADTIGGNSGSPVLNRAGEVVGVNFDRNRHGLVRNFVYTDRQARHISVHSRAVLAALEAVYGADALMQELNGRK